MTPSQILFAEHVNILKALVAAEKATVKLESSDDYAREFWTNLIVFLKEYADNIHHVKEERLFLPEMQKQNEDFAKMVIKILQDHGKGREFVKDLEDASQKYLSGEKFAKNLMINAIRNYIALLRPHIVLENINFPKAEAKFSKEAIEKMSLEFGKDINNKYKTILKKLIKANG